GAKPGGVRHLGDEVRVATVVLDHDDPIAGHCARRDVAQAHAERGADLLFALEVDRTAMQLDEPLREREPEACPRSLRAALVEALEPAEHAIPPVLRDADTGVP